MMPRFDGFLKEPDLAESQESKTGGLKNWLGKKMEMYSDIWLMLLLEFAFGTSCIPVLTISSHLKGKIDDIHNALYTCNVMHLGMLMVLKGIGIGKNGKQCY